MSRIAMDIGSLPTAAGLRPASLNGADRWRPGLAAEPEFAEVFAASREGAGSAAALAFLDDAAAARQRHGLRDPAAPVEDQRGLLWVQDAAAVRLTGRPYRPGLPQAWRHRLVHVAARTPEDALFALEEGVRCRDLAGVIGEIAGNPRALDFTASRRLALAAQRHGVALWLVRLDARADLSAARARWRIAPAPSAPPRWNAAAPGAPAWRAELFRARAHPPGAWVLDAGDMLALRDGAPADRVENASKPGGISPRRTA